MSGECANECSDRFSAGLTQGFTQRGLPTSLRQDSWWLDCDKPSDDTPGSNRPGSDKTDDDPQGIPASQSARAQNPNNTPGSKTVDLFGLQNRLPFVLVLLLALGDWLFWGFTPGLSLAIFSWAVFGATLWLAPPNCNPKAPALLLLLASLPAIELFQTLSVGFLILGTVSSIAWLRWDPATGHQTLLKAATHLLRAIPFSGIRAVFSYLQKRQQNQVSGPGALRRSLQNWGFPIGGGLLLCALLLAANPVLENRLADLLLLDHDILPRIMFWFGLALAIWPFLAPPVAAVKQTEKSSARTGHRRFAPGLNPGSVLRALVLFNLILAVQSIMDLSILFAGADLPPGMTLATYAHRGAYPLLATAMLAGLFAILARPFLNSHAGLTPLMLLWLGQNAILGMTSLLRLDLYTESFGLTYLRLYAMIWIGLVVIGLLLTAWQVLKTQSNAWLLLRCSLLGVAALYLCTFVNFAGLIAQQNLDRAARFAQDSSAQSPDWYYLCTLGPMAAKSIALAQQNNPALKQPPGYASCWAPTTHSVNWREWGFRSWRLTSYAAGEFDQTTFDSKARRDENLTGG